ncbi:MAG TPA: helix-turn-helix domain-containing protein [Spirochaetia bacterium]|nr:helix-turn-helix domain-containing protein [Spirochaetia bacterium]
MADDLPDDLSVDLEILVNDPVPQSGDVRPFDSGSVLLCLLEQGWYKTALAVKLGLSRRTVYRWLETGQLDRRVHGEAARYKARPVVSHQIDAFSPIIEARLQA